MSTQTLLLELLGDREIIAYRPQLARLLGSATAALMLSQALYWQRIAGAGRWWYKARDAARDTDGHMLPPASAAEQSWEYETGLTRSEQERARRLLRDRGILHEQKKGIPPRLHFCVDLDRLLSILSEKTLTNQQTAESCRMKGGIQPYEGQNPAVCTAESSRILHRLRTDQSETTPPPPAGAGAGGKSGGGGDFLLDGKNKRSKPKTGHRKEKPTPATPDDADASAASASPDGYASNKSKTMFRMSDAEIREYLDATRWIEQQRGKPASGPLLAHVERRLLETGPNARDKDNLAAYRARARLSAPRGHKPTSGPVPGDDRAISSEARVNRPYTGTLEDIAAGNHGFRVFGWDSSQKA